MCRRAFSGVAGDSWTVPPREGAVQGGLSVPPERYPGVWRNDSMKELLYGQTVADAYRWLETDSNATRSFVAAEEALAAEVLGQCDTRARFHELFSRLYDYPKFGLPAQHGEPGGVLRWYYEGNSGLQSQSVLYSSANPVIDGNATLVLDPNAMAANGSMSVSGYAFSFDGALMAYRESSAGSDWQTMRVVRLDNETGAATPLRDVLTGVRYSTTAWTPDNKGFFYNRLPQPANASVLAGPSAEDRQRQLWYHVVGTPQAADTFVLALPEQPDASIMSQVTSDKQYLVLSISLGGGASKRLYLVLSISLGGGAFNRLWYMPLDALPVNASTGGLDLGRYDMRLPGEKRALLPLVKLVDDLRAAWTLVATNGSIWTLHTSLAASRFRLLRVNISSPGPADKWSEVISEHCSDIMLSVTALRGDVLVVRYLRDVSAVLHLRSLATGTLLQAVRLPGLGSVEVSARRESPILFFSYNSLTDPGAIYMLDSTHLTGQLPDLAHDVQLPGGYNLDDFVTTQVFVVSKDGAQVPMFIVSPLNVSLDGSNPTILVGYGFQKTITPSFAVSRLAFLRAYGGVFAIANIRGGSAKGRSWWEAGRRTKKQNSFDDFAACADYLVDSGITSPNRLAIAGKENGGLLMGAEVNQHPNMFAAVIADGGVMDLLRYPLFTVGQAWLGEYGDPANATDFPYLLASSPLDNVSMPNGTGQYPAVMVSTAIHDDRVVPSHSYKFIAMLQHALAGYPGSPQRNPLILRVERNAGHGTGTPTPTYINQISDQWAAR
ncbi:hypothetical protein WJX81_000149 [Elliptochloris bilobata]|uniref:Prolyl endopeptidase n=1 Tax=Elliptochloris bilobata TaxID=381761 RepID=A0AAW1SIV4_9CHLO